MPLRAFIVDDESLARERLRQLLAECAPEVDVVGEAGSGQEAVPLIHETSPDLLFLDVQMPILDGFDVIDMLTRPRPHIVFVTAYDEYALQAFEVHALDYLTKPVRLKRLERTLGRLGPLDGQDPQSGIDDLRRERGASPLKRLAVRAGQHIRIVQLDDVRYIASDDRLVFVHIPDGKYWTDFSLAELEDRLDGHFLRIHRSYLVNADFVKAIEPHSSSTYEIVLTTNERLPVARRRAQEVITQLGG